MTWHSKEHIVQCRERYDKPLANSNTALWMYMSSQYLYTAARLWRSCTQYLLLWISSSFTQHLPPLCSKSQQLRILDFYALFVIYCIQAFRNVTGALQLYILVIVCSRKGESYYTLWLRIQLSAGNYGYGTMVTEGGGSTALSFLCSTT